MPAPESDEVELPTVHETLDELGAASPRKTGLVMLRFFAGLTLADAAEALRSLVATKSRTIMQRRLRGL